MQCGIHSGSLRAVGWSEVAAGGFFFVGDPLMGPAIGVVLMLSRWMRQVVLRGHLPADSGADQAVRLGLSCCRKILDPVARLRPQRKTLKMMLRQILEICLSIICSVFGVFPSPPEFPRKGGGWLIRYLTLCH